MKNLSKQHYERLRDKIWDDLVSSGVSSDEDENFTAFDEVLGNHLPVDWEWDEENGSDICYACGDAQDYQTMEDVDVGLAIYCKTCHPIAKKLVEDIQKINNTLKMYKDLLDVEESKAGKKFLSNGYIRMKNFKNKKEKELDKFGYSK